MTILCCLDTSAFSHFVMQHCIPEEQNPNFTVTAALSRL